MHHLWAHSKDRYVKFCGHASDVRQQPSRQPVQCVMRATIQIDDKRQTTHPDDIINGLRIESTLLSRASGSTKPCCTAMKRWCHAESDWMDNDPIC